GGKSVDRRSVKLTAESVQPRLEQSSTVARHRDSSDRESADWSATPSRSELWVQRVHRCTDANAEVGVDLPEQIDLALGDIRGNAFHRRCDVGEQSYSLRLIEQQEQSAGLAEIIAHIPLIEPGDRSVLVERRFA